MNLGLLLIPALGGYLVLALTHRSRYWVARQEGYKLFFSAAIAGAALLVAARLITVFWPSDWLVPIVAWWRSYAPFDYAGTVVISILLAVAFPMAANPFFDKNKCAMQTAKASGDLIECLVQEAVESRGSQVVEVSTKANKCYIGFALESSVAADSEADIAISPIASGYRDSQTLDLKITTNYVPALLDSDLDLEHFRIVIPLAEIASARRFDPDTYQVFGDIKAGKRNASAPTA